MGQMRQFAFSYYVLFIFHHYAKLLLIFEWKAKYRDVNFHYFSFDYNHAKNQTALNGIGYKFDNRYFLKYHKKTIKLMPIVNYFYVKLVCVISAS